jgi:hypothetical protein
MTSFVRRQTELSMSFNPLQIAVYQKVAAIAPLAPLCITPSSKTTTINDPTAGMSSDQINNYMSNVGGDMCGYPETVRTLVGLGLNLSLVIFGVLTLSYAVIGATRFVYEKQVNDAYKPTDPFEDAQRKNPTMFADKIDINFGDDDDDGPKKPTGDSRADRRLKRKLGD